MTTYNKRYGVFVLKSGKLYGYVERSFSMDYTETHVRQWNLKDAIYFYKQIKKNHPDADAFIVRITSPYPKALEKKIGKKVRIHWKEYQAEINSPKYTEKFKWRNVPFSIEDKV